MSKVIALGCLVSGLLLFGLPVQARELPAFGAFPVIWLDSRGDVFPITTAPREAQREAWLAQKAISKTQALDDIVIEYNAKDPSARKGAEKLANYWADHHHYPRSRLAVQASLQSSWRGWVVVRPKNTDLSARPSSRLAAWLAGFSAPVAAVSAPDSDSIHVSQAAALSAPRFSAPAPVQPEDDGALGVSEARIPSRPLQWAPFVGLEVFSVEGSRRDRSEEKVRSTWMGPRIGADVKLATLPIFEVGVNGSFYRSLTGATADAQNTAAQEIEASTWILFRANTQHFGIPRIRLGAGYLSNSRTGNPASGAEFLPAFVGPRAWGELTADVDSIFSVALHGSATAAQRGLYEVGGLLSQSFYRDSTRAWQGSIGMNAMVALADRNGSEAQETWISFQLGLTGTF